MKKSAKLAAICLAAVFSSGCFGGREVNKRSFVQIIGIERRGQMYNVGLQLFRSESSDGTPDVTKANSYSVTGSGVTLGGAMADAELKSGKELFMGHTKLLVLGDGLKDPADELEYLLGEQLSPSCPAAYSGKPSEITDTLSEQGIYSAERIISVMENYVRCGRCIYTSAAEIAEAVTADGTAFILPAVYSDEKEVYFSGGVYGDADGFHGTATEDDIYGTALLNDSFPKDGRITAEADINGRTYSAEITGADCMRRVENDNGRLIFNADIKLKLKVDDSGGIDKKRIGNAVCGEVKDLVIDSFRTAVWDNRCDVFGISRLIRRDALQLYGNGTELADSCVFNVRVYADSV